MSQTFQMQNGDWVLSRGRPVLVADRQKLEQDLQENLSIATQPNGFGAGLDALLGNDTTLYSFRSTVQQNIRASIVSMQRLQDQYLASVRPNTERILGISSLTVSPADLGLGSAQTAYVFRLSVRPVQGTPLTTVGTLAT